MTKAFSDLKILDFTTQMGAYSTKLFADLGAEVVKVEPIEGDPTRMVAPFAKDDPTISLPFLYLNTNKKSIVVDIESAEGQQMIRQLVREYDIVVENFKPGYLESLGLSYEQLKIINPKLIMMSLTPFGQTGPYRDLVANDLIGLAMGGFLTLGGYPDTEPIRPYGNQAYFATSLFGAVGLLLAIYYRDTMNVGQYIDVSMQECVVLALENALQFYDLEGTVRKRVGAQEKQAGWGLYDCADGQVYIMTAGLTSSGGWENLVAWMIEMGVEQAAQLNDAIWQDASWRATQEAKQQFAHLFAQLAANRTKLELYEEGQARKVPICPVNFMTDVLKNPQLHAREFFKQLANDATLYTYPGPPYLFSTIKWALEKSAPAIGEHTSSIQHFERSNV